jgi:hypothetical protein
VGPVSQPLPDKSGVRNMEASKPSGIYRRRRRGANDCEPYDRLISIRRRRRTGCPGPYAPGRDGTFPTPVPACLRCSLSPGLPESCLEMRTAKMWPSDACGGGTIKISDGSAAWIGLPFWSTNVEKRKGNGWNARFSPRFVGG